MTLPESAITPFSKVAIESAASPLWFASNGLIYRIAELIGKRALHPARVVVLLPYAQLVPAARNAWSQCAAPGFAPRFETTRSWVRSIGASVPGEGDLAFDRAIDLVVARSLLEAAGLGSPQTVLPGRLLDMAHQLAPLAAAVPLPDRRDWSSRADAIVMAGSANSESGWFATETALARIAVAWAGASGYASDLLLDGTSTFQTNALIVLDGLQAEPLVNALAPAFGDRFFRMSLLDGASAARPELPSDPVQLHEATDPEDEAERAAACVLRHLSEGRAPVALAAIDRVLTRRISALLAGRGVVLHDETGWKLSTTRAGATLMSALQAAMRGAGSDAVLDWLKWAPAFDATTVARLEARLRRLGLRDWSDWVSASAASNHPDDVALRTLTDTIEAFLAPAREKRSLPDWLDAMRALLRLGKSWEPLCSDRAGAQVLGALHLDADPLEALWPAAASRDGRTASRPVSLADLIAWVRDVLEAESFVPTSPPEAAVQVVVMPLHHMLGRSFAAVVMPGCDERRLPAAPEPPGPWSARQRAALAMPSRDALAAAHRAAFSQWIEAPASARHCDVLWHCGDGGGETMRPSPLVQSLRLDGRATLAPDPRVQRALTPVPTLHPLPQGDRLPIAALSASAYEDLRRCPYRFFALRQLGLASADELDTELDKRDFGTWLHLVLRHFHSALKESPTSDRRARTALISIASERSMRELGLSDAAFLPFAAAWPATRDGYLDWLEAYEKSESATFAEAESAREQPLGQLRLIGRIDRIDRVGRIGRIDEEADSRTMVIDYKTEALAKTRNRVKQPDEDTQLAFYAALLEDDTLRAAYVNVGEKSSGTRLVEQHQIVDARDALIEGIVRDFARIEAGAPLPALGEGAVCDHCAARGLCRKDFWP